MKINRLLVIMNNYTVNEGELFIKHAQSIGIKTDTQPQDGVKYDAVCAIGGDGTILDAADTAVKFDIPVFGINTGRVGFLAAFDKDKLDTLTTEDLESLYLSERSILTSSISPENEVAINEIGLFKENVAKSIELSVFTGETDLGTYRCDGILISTPTGSTAYNLSAGGPVLMPDLPCIVVTPICAYRASGRSVVLDNKAELTIKMAQRDEYSVAVSDGKIIGRLGRGEEIHIKVYDRPLKLMLSRERSTYKLIAGTTGN